MSLLVGIILRLLVPVIGITGAVGLILYGVHRLETIGADARELRIQRGAIAAIAKQHRRAQHRNDILRVKIASVPAPPPPPTGIQPCPSDCYLPSSSSLPPVPAPR